MRLLLFSNSTNAGEPYLGWALPHISAFLQPARVSSALFIPYAAVSFSYDEYLLSVQEKFSTLGIKVQSVHNSPDPVAAVQQAQCIVVGGGNTFHLLKNVQDNQLIEAIRTRVMGGTPYIGWSAGSNLACPTLCTTNDMPIVQPQSFSALHLVPFQINPHYLDAHPSGHAGETREQRLTEFIIANPHRWVAGLREGSAFLVENRKLQLKGDKSVRVFKQGRDAAEYQPGDDLSFLMQVD
ncbi:MAG: dipeptidase PepE [Bacteroidetes bacterium]|nr:dipeptidase PepE [Bacteroidota bacterium]